MVFFSKLYLVGEEQVLPKPLVKLPVAWRQFVLVTSTAKVGMMLLETLRVKSGLSN